MVKCPAQGHMSELLPSGTLNTRPTQFADRRYSKAMSHTNPTCHVCFKVTAIEMTASQMITSNLEIKRPKTLTKDLRFSAIRNLTRLGSGHEMISFDMAKTFGCSPACLLQQLLVQIAAVRVGGQERGSWQHINHSLKVKSAISRLNVRGVRIGFAGPTSVNVNSSALIINLRAKTAHFFYKVFFSRMCWPSNCTI